MGFPFENYKANPLASIHTTLKRMVPGEIEVKTLKGGKKVYRLKSAGDWARAFAEASDWLDGFVASGTYGATASVMYRRPLQEEKKDTKKQQGRQGAEHGPSGRT